jgi:hypothetical protein
MRSRSYVYATALAIGSLATVTANTPIFHDGIMDFVIAQDFTQIKVAELPTAISDAVNRDYPDATIDKAFVNGEEKYKLEITQEGGTSLEIYSDARGNWIEM